MTIQQLQYVVALDTHRHFVRAAESCFVAQPTLTLQIKKLEDEMGINIFDRSTHPLQPTTMGGMFIIKARQILRDINELKEMVNEDKNQLKGLFRIGVIPTLSPYLLPLFLKKFSDAHPEARLEIREVQSEQVVSKIQENSLDIGIMATPVDAPQIREVPLFYEPFLIYAQEDHVLLKKDSVQVEDIKEKGLWLLDQGHCFRNQVLNICNKSAVLSASDSIVFESGSIETLKNMIKNHSGYTLIPELSVQKQVDTRFVRRFAAPEPAREVSVVVHKNFTKELFLNNLRKAILDAVPGSFKKNKRFVTIKWR